MIFRSYLRKYPDFSPDGDGFCSDKNMLMCNGDSYWTNDFKKQEKACGNNFWYYFFRDLCCINDKGVQGDKRNVEEIGKFQFDGEDKWNIQKKN